MAVRASEAAADSTSALMICCTRCCPGPRKHRSTLTRPPQQLVRGHLPPLVIRNAAGGWQAPASPYCSCAVVGNLAFVSSCTLRRLHLVAGLKWYGSQCDCHFRQQFEQYLSLTEADIGPCLTWICISSFRCAAARTQHRAIGPVPHLHSLDSTA